MRTTVLTPQMSLPQAVKALAEGNQEASKLLWKIALGPLGSIRLLDLDDIELRGKTLADVWKSLVEMNGSEDAALDKLLKGLINRDVEFQPQKPATRSSRGKRVVKQSTYVHPQRVVPRCSECGLRRRGSNHDLGQSHIDRQFNKRVVKSK